MKNLFLILITIIISTFNSSKSIVKDEALLVMSNPLQGKISYSKFLIIEENGILVGYNTLPNDYPVVGGVYRIEATSKMKFYHKKIAIF